ncbi:MAG TPA: PEP/pyruvate-binding domain-containing protein [Burkholderiales bacterium]
MQQVLDFSEPVAAQAELSGGKGANLALLTQRGFAVPKGFVVSALAYRAFVAEAGHLLQAVDQFSFDAPATLAAQARALREQLARLPLPREVMEEVRALHARFPKGTAFSVRSSSTFEDLAGAAFAGQHDTFLNCVGIERILERVRDCFVSLWQDRALLYRASRGFDHRAAAMAVVLQEMVQAEVAGVGFTVNPVNGRLDEMLVNANYGLGESVVSGEGAVDQFVLGKADGELRSAEIGRKSHRVVSGRDGVVRREVDAAAAARPCLDGAELRELAALMREVEKSYQFPQDIEWARAGGRFYVLQSRPVTALPPRWTRDESAERFPNAVTPLAWDFVEEGFHRSLNHSFRLMGYPPYSGKWFGMHGHYIYGNQNAVEIYGGRQPLAVRSLAELEAQLPTLARQFAWVQELPVEWSRDLDHYLLRIGEFMAEPLDTKSLPEVWAFVNEVNRLGSEYFLPNIAISLTQRALYRVLHGLLGLLLGDKAAATRAFDALLAWCDTKTAVVNKELYEMAQIVRGDAKLRALLAGSDSRALLEGDALAPFPEFSARFARFLRDHGHREVDFDPYVPTWAEAPWVVLDNLRLMVDAAESAGPRDKERELKIRMQQAELELLSRIPPSLHFFFNELLRLARTYTSLDDVEHYQTTRLTLPLRRGLRELGHRLVRRGVLEEPMDVFFARFKALDEAIRLNDDARWDALCKAVAEEKAAYLADRARTPEWVLGEAGSAQPAAAEGALSGLAGSPGVAEGPVFVVLSPEDFPHFPKGAVLVARTTNPAWTPLFYSACAVVTESGGPLSHGAVTAREMQIPAVMSVHGVLTRLSNGQRVRVDGAAGRVTLL